MTIEKIMIFVFIAINVFCFFLMLSDKGRSRRGDSRISEGSLLFSAICFGAFGIWAGMICSRHKTQKMIFALGVPLAFLQNIALAYVIYELYFLQR